MEKIGIPRAPLLSSFIQTPCCSQTTTTTDYFQSTLHDPTSHAIIIIIPIANKDMTRVESDLSNLWYCSASLM